MPNRERGEMEIQLKGKMYTLRPSFEGLCEVEDRAGAGLTALLVKFQNQKAGMRDVAALIYGGLIGAGHRDLSFQQVGEEVTRRGWAKFVTPAANFLAQAIRGTDEIEEASSVGKAVAAEEKTVAPPVQAAE